MEVLSESRILISGQVLVGRIETLEYYLKGKVCELSVIGVDNFFSPTRLGRYTFYKGHKMTKNIPLPSIKIRQRNHMSNILFVCGFLLQLFTIFFSALFSNAKYDLFIGIGCFPAFVGLLLKKVGKIRHLIYYCIDYFPPQSGFSFNRILLRIIQSADVACVKGADLVWHISPLIADARQKYTGLAPSRYRHIVVPLCFNSSTLRYRSADEINRFTLAFVGTSGYFHGLELLFEAAPLIIREIPQVKIEIIGVGPWEDLKEKVKNSSLEDYFIFRGYIEDERELIDELSKLGLGVALYIPIENNPTVYADPGKPKLYAFCGLPVVITKTPYVSREIQGQGAGIAIDYRKEDLVSAVASILRDSNTHQKYREQAFSFAQRYTSDKIYDEAFSKSWIYIRKE